MKNHWEHFSHAADIGVRGIGESLPDAFGEAAKALTAVVTDLDKVNPDTLINIECDNPDRELLFVDWLNALVYEMATRCMLFSKFDVELQNNILKAQIWGEVLHQKKHQPAVEVKGATYTCLKVGQLKNQQWMAQTVVDV